jgi:adenylate cyclase
MRLKFAYLCLALLVGLSFAAIHYVKEERRWDHNFIHDLELNYLDHKFRSRGALDISPKVVIAAVDERAIEAFGVWGSWPRTVFADMITNLVEAGAAVVGFDMVWADEMRNRSRVAAKRILKPLHTLGLVPPHGAGDEQDDEGEGEETSRDAGKKPGVGLGPLQAWLAAHPDDPSAPAVRAALENLQAQLNSEAGVWQDPDDALTRVIDEYSDRLVLGYVILYKLEDEGFMHASHGAPDWLSEAAYVDAVYALDRNDADGQPRALALEPHQRYIDALPLPAAKGGAIEPLAKFIEPAEYLGYFSVNPDGDGTLRNIHLLAKMGEHVAPALALQVASVYHGASILPLANEFYPNALGGIRFLLNGAEGKPDPVLPTDQSGRLLINFPGKPGSVFPRFSIGDIVEAMKPEVAAQALAAGTISAAEAKRRSKLWTMLSSTVKNRVVLFGNTAIGTYDQRITPFSEFGPGVEIHAAAVQNILDGRYLKRPWYMASLEALSMLGLAMLLGMIMSNVSVPMSFGAALMGTGFWYLTDTEVLFPSGYWAHGVLATLMIWTVWAVLTVYGYLTEGRERAKTRKVLEGYVSPSVAQQVMNNSSLLKLGGDERDLTVLFSDIRGFTTMSEQFSAGELTNFLNEYFTPMTALVFEHGGTLDKYMGDAIMAFFGAPGALANHAEKSCLAAIDMVECLNALNERWAERGLPGIDIGIGVNSGPMRVGNMGSTQRMDYTVMGDNVNLGSRLEGINKAYGTRIMASEFTEAAARDAIHFREIDSVRVKGKLEPVRIFEVVGRGPVAPPDTAAWVDPYETGLEYFRGQRWDEAKAAFAQVLDVRPTDLAARIFIERCTSMAANPPGESWDGVFTMTSK